MNTTALLPVDLGDKRLDSRCNKLIEQFMAKPSSSIPQACVSWKDTKAAYRFFSNDLVSPDNLLAAHYSQTQKLLKKQKGIILAAQDTTDIDHTTHPGTNGLGYLEMEHLYGMKVHSCMAITETGVPLGLLNQQRWVRNQEEYGKRQLERLKPIEEKESFRWISTMQAVESSVPKNKTVILIGDRESDIYALFATKRQNNMHLLVRAGQNRNVESEQKHLFPTIKELPVAGRLEINLAKTPKRKPRVATLSIQYGQVTLKSPSQGVGKAKGRVTLFAVAALEENAPKGVEPVKWMLLTTSPVASVNDATRVINWYTKRWLIERFHYALKSGCQVEELQLKEAIRLERALALYTIVAWQLLYITYETREHPNIPCTKILTTDEWQALVSITEGKKTRRTKPPAMQEAVQMIAKLGGFLGRKGDKEPGVKTLWIGLRRLSDIAATWSLLLGVDKDVGKG